MSWLVVATKPQQEIRAEVNLRRQSFECYFPRTKIMGRIRPLFPSYGFVRSDHHSLVSNTYGVRTVVKLGEDVATISDKQVDEIRNREDNGIVVLECPYHKGDNLSWGTIPVIFEEMLDVDRCKVLFSILGRTAYKILRFQDLAKPD